MLGTLQDHSGAADASIRYYTIFWVELQGFVKVITTQNEGFGE